MSSSSRMLDALMVPGTPQRWVLSVIFIVASLVLSIVLLSVASYQTGKAISDEIFRISAAANVLSAVKDAETGQRGYIITRNEEYLAPYSAALSSIPSQLESLSKLFSENQHDKLVVADISRLTSERLRLLNRTISIVRTQGLEAASAAMQQGRGLTVMNEFRAKIGALINVEREEQIRQLRRLAILQTLFYVATGALVILISTTLMGAVLFNRTMLESAMQKAVRQDALIKDVLEASPDSIFIKDADGIYTHANKATLAVMGVARATGLKDSEIFPAGLWEKIIADDARAMSSIDGYTFEEDIHIAGAPKKTFLTTKSPVRDQDGRTIALLGVAKDITDRKKADEQQRLLLSELNHRVKNALAVVHAIAVQTFSDASLASRKAFEGRLMALSAAHNALTANDWHGASLRDVVNNALFPHCGASDEICQKNGPEIELSSSAALALSLVLHELATNAAKYGALSVSSGRIDVSWRTHGEDLNKELVLVWTEAGGPAVAKPSKTGFGTKLIQRSLGDGAKASVTIDYAYSGLICTIKLINFGSDVGATS